MSFFKKSLEELDHVVWPTNAESKKYMLYTVSTIIVMASFLAVIGYFIQTGLKGIRNSFPHDPIISTTVSGEEGITEADIENLRKEAEKRRNSLSGANVQVETTSTETQSPIELNLSGTGN